MLKTEEYEGEDGFTPEDRLTMFLTHLEKNNEVIDDYSGNGSAFCQGGAYFPSGGNVPGSSWDRGGRQFRLGESVPDLRFSYSGSASGVRIKA